MGRQAGILACGSSNASVHKNIRLPNNFLDVIHGSGSLSAIVNPLGRTPEEEITATGVKSNIHLPSQPPAILYAGAEKNISMPPGRIWEMHLNTKKVYETDSKTAVKYFKTDIEHDLKLIKELAGFRKLGAGPVILLNTFNRHWLKRTEEILGGERHNGIVLTRASCRIYKPRRHKKIFARMFPKCLLVNPGRSNPCSWDLIISSNLKGETNVKIV